MTLLAELDQRQERVLTELDLLNQRAEALLASFLAITRPEGSGEPVANIAGIASPKTESGAAAANSSLRIYNNQNADDSDDEYESDSDSYDSSDDDQD